MACSLLRLGWQKIQDPALISVLIAGKYDEIYPPSLSTYIQYYKILLDRNPENDRKDYKFCICTKRSQKYKYCCYHKTDIQRINKHLESYEKEFKDIKAKELKQKIWSEISPKDLSTTASTNLIEENRKMVLVSNINELIEKKRQIEHETERLYKNLTLERNEIFQEEGILIAELDFKLKFCTPIKMLKTYAILFNVENIELR